MNNSFIRVSKENIRLLFLCSEISLLNQNKIGNLALKDFLPLFLSESRKLETPIGREIDLLLRKQERNKLNVFRYEMKSRIAFIKNMAKTLRDMRIIGASTIEIKKLVENYVDTAFTYENPEEIINKLKSFINDLKEDKQDLLNYVSKSIEFYKDKIEFRSYVNENNERNNQH